MSNESAKMNSLTGLLEGLAFQSPMQTAPISQSDTMFVNNRYYLISNMRSLISQMYVEHGIVQTLVDQPVDDAYRTGIQIYSKQLSPEEVKDLERYLINEGILEEYKQARKWTRLYGGGGLIVNTGQDPQSPLNLGAINKKTPLEFYAADLWELAYQGLAFTGMNPNEIEETDSPYNYYGEELHKTRLLKMVGKQAPSFVRPRLRGWGMSELERLVRSINSYLKNQDVIFELLDEAKIDVYRIDGFNSSLMTPQGTNALQQRIQVANQVKSYLNALTMDMQDDYQQKQMTFTGLGEMLTQIRQGVAADLKMPLTKLFGISAAGFNSGEDDIKNYNSMIESEIRAKDKNNLIKLVGICCMKLFEFIPDDLDIEFPALAVLSEEQEQEVKQKEFQRLLDAYDRQLITEDEFKAAVNNNNLLPIQLKGG